LVEVDSAKYRFPGGVHPPDLKQLTRFKSIQEIKSPTKVYIPLSQHIGKPAEPVVAVDDYVKKGQLIASAAQGCSANVHASISGRVVDITGWAHPLMRSAPATIIENDNQNIVINPPKPRNIESLKPQEIVQVALDAGLVGMGGAGFPTHIKLSPPAGQKIDVLIVNGCECESVLSCDFRLMVEEPEVIIAGSKLAARAVGAERIIIAIENNKPEAIESISEAIGYDNKIEIIQLKTRYPQGGEKQLIYALTGRKVPAGGLPFQVGVVVHNVATLAALARSAQTGMPLVQRVITVAGCVKNPMNLLVPVGTTYRDVINACGGYDRKPGKIISGGPMMGTAEVNVDVPVTKTTSGIIVLTESESAYFEEDACIRCARCVDVCPMNLYPLLIARYARYGEWEKVRTVSPQDCIECGACAYVCPAHIPLVHYIKWAKSMT